MAKVIAINKETVTIGLDDGSMMDVLPDEINFRPYIGDEVEIYRSNDMERVIVTRKNETPRYRTEGQYQYRQKTTYVNDDYNDYRNPYEVKRPGKYVNKYLYLGLALFFGYFGAHHFYAGNWKKGVLYLLFYWTTVPVFLSFFDFFKVLFMPSKNGVLFIDRNV